MFFENVQFDINKFAVGNNSFSSKTAADVKRVFKNKR